MGHSNEEWAEFAADPEVNKRWDEYAALPFLPDNDPALNKFMSERGLLREDLMRVGARWGRYKGQFALVYFFLPGYRKYRTLSVPALRGTDDGATPSLLKIVKSPTNDGGVIIAEGETDAALLTRLAPSFDVAILPAGAKHFTEDMAAQLRSYDSILVGTDNDEAGESGAARILALLPTALRLKPPDPHKDWCEAFIAGALDSSWVPVGAPRPKTIFTIRELLDADLGTLSENNWFADGVAPVGGEIVIHGPMKSLKSVILMEMIRAISTGTQFAGYLPFIRDDGPGKVLLFQMEIPPHGFQLRMKGMVDHMYRTDAELFEENVSVYGVANRKMPRLKIQSPEFVPSILAAIEESGAEVVALDPIQRMTGSANIDKPHEIDPLLGLIERLTDSGITVIYTHHNNKAERNSATPYSMSGSQRFGADADAICSVYHDKHLVPDNNPRKETQRNFVWTLRSGSAVGRSITAKPSASDPSFMIVEYGDLIVPAPTAPPASTATSAGSMAGMPAIT